MASDKAHPAGDLPIVLFQASTLAETSSDAEKQSSSETLHVPDGGYEAWLTVAGAWLIMFCTFGYANAFGIYEDYYTRIYMANKSSSDISWIGSVHLCLQFLMGLVAGKLFDQGYFYTTMRAGSVLYVFSLFMLSLAKENQYYQVFLPQAVGLGIGVGLLFLPSLGVISHHFSKRRSFATGIVTTGTSCGGVIFPIMLNKLFQRFGFANGVRASAFVVLGLLIIANLLMRTRLPPKSKGAQVPPPDFKAIMTDSAYLLTILGAFLILLGLFFPIFYLQLFAVVHGLDETLAFYSLAIMNAASVLGRTIPNFFADRFGAFNLVISCSAISGALIFTMFGVKSSGTLIVFSILYGFFSGAYISLIYPLIISLANGLNEVGTRLGTVFTIIAFAALTGTPIAGALLTGHLSWWRPITFSGVIVICGATALALARAIQAKRKGHSLV
ncbi:major facilitator superfamily transporter [Ceratobasidium sp. AG-Ba]|nr:major facilitator superfamily transporter [Ceratobasidium sp. AG-Ba]